MRRHPLLDHVSSATRLIRSIPPDQDKIALEADPGIPI
jgi:hypothetical protein